MTHDEILKVGSEGLPPSVLREFNQRVLKYQRMYVTLQVHDHLII